MQHRSFTHQPAAGWSQPLPSALDSASTLVLAFGAREAAGDGPAWSRPAPLEELAAAFPSSVFIGCSTSGEIHAEQVQDNGFAVAVLRFEHSRLRRASVELAGAADSFQAGLGLAGQLAAADQGLPLAAVFLLSDGLCVNGTALIAGLRSGLPATVAVSGGLAGDGSRFGRTWVLDDAARPCVGLVSAVGLYGTRLRVGHGCDGGWSDFGPERRITRSEGNVLYELDGRPALDLYKTYLGERAAELPGSALLFPLSVRRDEAEPTSVVRTILKVDEARRSMTFAGDMPQGGVARLMRASNEKLIGSAGLAARQALGAVADGPAAQAPLLVSVSCVGRRLVLGERTDEEVEAVLGEAPTGAGHVGFYSYGEVAPMVAGGASDLHNQTMTVTVFAEV